MRGDTENSEGAPASLAADELNGYPSIADALSDHIAILDSQGVIVAINATWRRLLAEGRFVGDCPAGIGANYLEVCRHSSAVPLPASEDVEAGLQEVLDGHQDTFSCEYPSGNFARDRWFGMFATALPNRRGVVVSHREITARQAAEAERRSRCALCNGASGGAGTFVDFNSTTERRILEAVDLEKQRFATELHENLCQFLVGISLLGNALDEELLRLNLSQSQDARQITSMAKEAVVQVRGFVKQLSPLPLGHGEGLVPALEDLAEQAESGGKIKCRFYAPVDTHTMEPVIAMHLYRIAQEAVYNAIKHAQAKRLSIRVTVGRRKIVLTVRDNGIGFIPRPESSSGIGLRMMNSRARAIRATLEFRKLPVKGTAVICTVPK